MRKIYKKLTNSQKERGIIFSSSLSKYTVEEKDGLTHEVTTDQENKDETIRRLLDDSFFNKSPWKYNIIRKDMVLEIKHKTKKPVPKTDFKTVAMIAKVGDFVCETQKEKNAWKIRMLKAAFEKKGLQIPTGWDGIDEEEKARRLDKVLEAMKEINKEVKA